MDGLKAPQFLYPLSLLLLLQHLMTIPRNDNFVAYNRELKASTSFQSFEMEIQ